MDIVERLRVEGAYMHPTSEIISEAANEIEQLRTALRIAQIFCNSLSAEDCPDAVAIPINEALKVPNGQS